MQDTCIALVALFTTRICYSVHSQPDSTSIARIYNVDPCIRVITRVCNANARHTCVYNVNPRHKVLLQRECTS